MKKLYLISVMGFLLAFASVASADMIARSKKLEGGLVGNGGGTVVCRMPDQQIKRIELLDYYEVAQHPGMVLNLEGLNGDWKARTQQLIDRIRFHSELRYQLYSRWLKSFESERILLQDVQMSTVNDAGHVVVPRGCAFEQAAIQRRPIFAHDPRYFLNAELWNAMDETQKAGLVLHELIYREALAYGHTDSIRTRYLNTFYASKDFFSTSLESYMDILSQARFELVDLDVSKELYKNSSSTFYFGRLDQPGPGVVADASFVFNQRIILNLGRCEGAGCADYRNYRNTIRTNDIGYANWVIPADVSELNFGDLKFINSQVGFGMTLFGKDKPTIIAYSFGNKFDQIFSVIHQNKSASMLYRMNATFSAEGSRVNWMNVKGYQVMDDAGKMFPAIYSVDDCTQVHLDFENSKVLARVDEDARTDENNCITKFIPSFVTSNSFSNGTLHKTFQKGVTITYDLDALRIDPLDQEVRVSGWNPKNGTVNPVSCRDKAPQAYLNNCMVALFNAAKMMQLKVVEETAYVWIKGSGIPVKIGTALDLYANGKIRSVVVGATSTIYRTENEAEINLKLDDVIEFNEDGRITNVIPAKLN